MGPTTPKSSAASGERTPTPFSLAASTGSSRTAAVSRSVWPSSSSSVFLTAGKYSAGTSRRTPPTMGRAEFWRCPVSISNASHTGSRYFQAHMNTVL